MFYWETAPTSSDPAYLAANTAIAIVNVGWIVFDSLDTPVLGAMWGSAWAAFVGLQWRLLLVKNPGMYLAVAISSRAVVMYAKKNAQ